MQNSFWWHFLTTLVNRRVRGWRDDAMSLVNEAVGLRRGARLMPGTHEVAEAKRGGDRAVSVQIAG